MNNKEEKEDWLKHKSLWESSGLSQRQYCQGASLCPRKFNYHLKRLSKKKAVTSDFKFIGVPSSILEKKALKEARGTLKIELPNGVSLVLELSADMTLSQVIDVVGAVRC
jgi:hypothetical protein